MTDIADTRSETPESPTGPDDTSKAPSDTKQLATGGAVLALAMMAANAGNYILNVLLARWLTPAEFADANLMVTLMLLITAVAIGLQLITARYAGINAVSGTADGSDGDNTGANAAGDSAAGDGVTGDLGATTALGQWLTTRSLTVGAVLGLILGGGAPFWQDFFRSESALPFIILGIGMPFYLAQAVGRGILQGELRFASLAATFVFEMVVRVGLGVSLVAMGLGVEGATAALTASFIATWAHVHYFNRNRPQGSIDRDGLRPVLRYAAPVGLLLLAQIIINNGDVLIAKRFLDPYTAGIYAAIALVGRAVFFLSWSVATTLFPASAQRHESGEQSNGLMWAGCGVLVVIGLAATTGARLLGGTVLGRVFGPEYGDVSVPLAWYALATSLFAIANLIATHHLSTGRIREAFVLLAGGGLQTSLLLLGRNNIDTLVRAQVISMSLLLLLVLISHFLPYRRKDTDTDVKNDAVIQNAPERETSMSTESDVPASSEAAPGNPKFEMPATMAELRDAAGVDSGQTSQPDGGSATSPELGQYRQWASVPQSGTPVYSIVIPMYNEEIRILPTVGAIANHMVSLGRSFELVLADDGSTDSTLQLVRDMELANVTILEAEQNGGKGSAVRRGVLASRGDIILFADADQSTPIEQFTELEEVLHKGFGVVVGSRAAAGAEVANKSRGRQILSNGLKLLVQGSLRLPISDTQCGFKMFTRDAAQSVFSRQLIDGFSFDLEVLYLARRMGIRVTEVPVQWFDAPGSKVDSAKVAVRFLQDLVRIRVNAAKGRYDRVNHAIPEQNADHAASTKRTPPTQAKSRQGLESSSPLPTGATSGSARSGSSTGA